MQQVLKRIFLVDEKFESNLKFWVLLGPFFLLLTIALASFELCIITAASLFLCYRFRFKGLYISLALLIFYSFYVQVNLETFHLWNLGLEISIALGLITTAFGLDEIKNFIVKGSSTLDKDVINLKNELNERQKIFENTERNFQGNLSILNVDLDKKDKQLNSLLKENETIKSQLQESIEKKDYLLGELDQKVKEIDDLKIIQDELYEKLAYLKDEEFLQEKNKSFQKELSEVNQRLQNQKEEKDKVHHQLNEKLERIKTLENSLQNSSQSLQNIESLNLKLNQKEDVVNELKTQIESFDINIKDIEDLNQKLKEKDSLIQELQNNNKSSEESLEDVQKINETLNQKEEVIKELQLKLQNATKNVQEIEAFKEKVLKQESLIEKLKSQKTEKTDNKVSFENITDQKLLKEYENKLKEFKKLDSLYVQLKDQFEEKQLVLHKTRQDLFAVNEKLTAIQRDKNDDFKDLSDNEKALLKDLDTTESELKVYKEENQNLQNLIDHFMEKNDSTEKENQNTQESAPL
ncbi:MAG: hypothetical protein K1060chlam1_00045 [Candidatus Anoxychlamydiales bacterium]|nr:hypothetical protein [Candidatus Anoxychlamydiales bacterium]